MTKQELTDKFNMLYRYMATSRETEYMMTFGAVMKQMMAWMIENRPEQAEEYIETLCSIKWRQYLTRSEAAGVLKEMVPSAPWDYDTWHRAMESLGIGIEKEMEYNKYALWVAMNQIYSDFGETIAKTLGRPLGDLPAETIVPIVYDMAIDLLEDPDGKYNIRKYHLC